MLHRQPQQIVFQGNVRSISRSLDSAPQPTYSASMLIWLGPHVCLASQTRGVRRMLQGLHAPLVQPISFEQSSKNLIQFNHKLILYLLCCSYKSLSGQARSDL